MTDSSESNDAAEKMQDAAKAKDDFCACIRLLCRRVRHVAGIILEGLLKVEGLLTAFATFAIALVAYWQWLALEKTDQTLNITLVASTRAWISPTEAAYDGDPKMGDSVRYKILYGNTGREPAQAFGAQQRTGVVENAERGNRSWYDVLKPTDIQDLCKSSGAADDAPTIYPSGLRDYSYRVADSAKIPNEVITGAKVMFVQGCFTYKTFKTRAESAWCFLLVPETGEASKVISYRSVRCPYGNRAT